MVADPKAAEARADAKVERAVTRGKEVQMTKGGLMLANMADLMDFARMAVANQVAPKGMNEGQAALAIQAGMERGMGVLGGLQACVVINGVLSFRGWAAIGLIQSSGLCVPGTFRTYFDGKLEDGTGQGVCIAQRKGYDQAFVRKFTIADAKKARLWGKSGPWTERPTNMLEWRAVGDMARFHFPEALGGIPIAEDVEAGGVGHVDVQVGPGTPPGGPARLGPGPALMDPLLGQLVSAAAEEEAAEDPEMGVPPKDKLTDEELDTVGAQVRADKREAAEETGAGDGGPLAGSDDCPRCGGKDTGMALFGKCAACNYPEAEPGEVSD